MHRRNALSALGVGSTVDLVTLFAQRQVNIPPHNPTPDRPKTTEEED
jgi:hypothetical protein